MQLSLYQLASHLKQSLKPCYLLHGDEWLLAEEAQINIADAANLNGFSDKQVFHIQQESDWHLLNVATQGFDLFAQKQFFLIRCSSPNITKSTQSLIEKQLTNQSNHQIWVMLTPKIKKSDQKKSWYQSIVKQGIVVPIYELTESALQTWIEHKLKHAQLKITDQAVINQLIVLTEGNLLALDQAIQKLKLLFPTKTLTLEDIHFAIHANTRFNVFQLTDRLLDGQTQKALDILHYLHEINHPPLLILWAITRELRELITLSHQLLCNIPMQQLLKSQWPKRRLLLKTALARLSYPHLEQLLLFCSKIDKMFKNVNLTDAWKALDVLVVRFTHPNFLKR